MGAIWRRRGVPAAHCPLAAAPHGAFRHGIRQNIRQNICHWRLRCLRHASNDTTPRATRQSQQCRLAGPRRLRTRIIAVARRGMRGLMEDGMSSDDWQDVRGTPDDPNALRGKRVLIMGLGLLGGGVAAARYAVQQGAAEVVATDLRNEAVLAPSIAKLATKRCWRRASPNWPGSPSATSSASTTWPTSRGPTWSCATPASGATPPTWPPHARPAHASRWSWTGSFAPARARLPA